MDLNLVVLAGRLAATPEIRIFESGSRLVRLSVTTSVEEPRKRIDVTPVVMWDVGPDHMVYSLERGDRVWIAGAIQRRFWSDDQSRRSRIEVVAQHVQAYGRHSIEKLLDADESESVGITADTLDWIVKDVIG